MEKSELEPEGYYAHPSTLDRWDLAFQYVGPDIVIPTIGRRQQTVSSYQF